MITFYPRSPRSFFLEFVQSISSCLNFSYSLLTLDISDQRHPVIRGLTIQPYFFKISLEYLTFGTDHLEHRFDTLDICSLCHFSLIGAVLSNSYLISLLNILLTFIPFADFMIYFFEIIIMINLFMMGINTNHRSLYFNCISIIWDLNFKFQNLEVFHDAF